MIKLITYHYMEKRVARGAVEKKINPETSFVFVYYGMLQRRSCLDICNSTSQVMLEVFSTEGSVECQSYCRRPAIYLILY